jgi:hypothetical protein
MECDAIKVNNEMESLSKCFHTHEKFQVREASGSMEQHMFSSSIIVNLQAVFPIKQSF